MLNTRNRLQCKLLVAAVFLSIAGCQIFDKSLMNGAVVFSEAMTDNNVYIKLEVNKTGGTLTRIIKRTTADKKDIVFTGTIINNFSNRRLLRKIYSEAKCVPTGIAFSFKGEHGAHLAIIFTDVGGNFGKYYRGGLQKEEVKKYRERLTAISTRIAAITFEQELTDSSADLTYEQFCRMIYWSQLDSSHNCDMSKMGILKNLRE